MNIFQNISRTTKAIFFTFCWMKSKSLLLFIYWKKRKVGQDAPRPLILTLVCMFNVLKVCTGGLSVQWVIWNKRYPRLFKRIEENVYGGGLGQCDHSQKKKIQRWAPQMFHYFPSLCKSLNVPSKLKILHQIIKKSRCLGKWVSIFQDLGKFPKQW